MDNNYYLAKWMNGELSESELLTYVNAQELAIYKRIISHTNSYKKPVINSPEILKNVLKNAQKSSQVKKRAITVFYRVAALLILSLTVYYFSQSNKVIFNTNNGEKLALILPDNSEVHLNAESKITYTKNEWKNNRNIHLKGEAYFKVSKGATFSVRTAAGIVSVLGTQFNVLSRARYFEVTCFEGLVEVTYQEQKYLIAAKNSFKLIDNNPVLSTEVKNKTPYWTADKSHFKSSPFHLVIDEFERQYNLKISYPNSLKNEFFTGEFTHNNSQQALNAIALPFNLTITHKNKQVELSK